MENYTATVADNQFEFTGRDLTDLDLVGPFEGIYHLLHGGKSYRCALLELHPYRKQILVSIDGRRISVTLADDYDRTVERLGLATSVTQQSNDVMAPMPGLILDVLVEEGQEVEAGTPLIVLEAMKMENVIKADGAGTVKEIKVNKGDAVDKRQLLIEME